ncbi:ferredoxin--NADP reductase [Rhabdobacter roseus]|uniref:Ring-1,2-phenylacetyl-CoA epoxidase subunit PaaE n=1 Tax=Rhabdobacter roseus TaxID=1655419 RepID=A0A840TS67_9BACT|nr:ferredoxin--NADP reductase [Rhabdobacter roseus]MBB5286791.1 ring-1,2-phenylacetyl-CoA epoxidase subunit PaaE [Rhabdobacter roseus]
MSKYYYLKVKDVVRETPDTATIHFWHPLNEVIKYKPGQFLTLLIPQGDTKLRRSYSMCSSPYTDVALAITIKRVSGGFASNYLIDSVQVGDSLEVMEPMGTFTPQLDAEQQRTVVLVGAGSGVTPLISIAKSVLIVEPESTVYLLYGNRNEASILFKTVIDQLQAKYGERFRVVHTLSQPSGTWTGETGRLNKTHMLKMLEKLPPVDPTRAEYYLCGPDTMMEEAQRALDILGVPAPQVRRESFLTATTAKAHGEVTVGEEEDEGSLKTREITVIYEGSEYKFPVEPHQTVLEAALDRDIDLPYSCQAGMCTACLGRCVSGQVQLDEEDALSEAELKAGFILTCVTHPLSDDVVIEVE